MKESHLFTTKIIPDSFIFGFISRKEQKLTSKWVWPSHQIFFFNISKACKSGSKTAILFDYCALGFSPTLLSANLFFVQCRMKVSQKVFITVIKAFHWCHCFLLIKNVDDALKHLSVLGLCGPSLYVPREISYSSRSRAEEREQSWYLDL